MMKIKRGDDLVANCLAGIAVRLVVGCGPGIAAGIFLSTDERLVSGSQLCETTKITSFHLNYL